MKSWHSGVKRRTIQCSRQEQGAMSCCRAGFPCRLLVPRQLVHFGLSFDGLQFLIHGLHLFFGGFQLLIGGLQLLVGGRSSSLTDFSSPARSASPRAPSAVRSRALAAALVPAGQSGRVVAVRLALPGSLACGTFPSVNTTMTVPRSVSGSWIGSIAISTACHPPLLPPFTLVWVTVRFSRSALPKACSAHGAAPRGPWHRCSSGFAAAGSRYGLCGR